MSESMPGWGEFQSALSQLQAVAGGGTAGGGGGSSAGGGATGSQLTGPGGVPANTPISINVGPGSGVSLEAKETLASHGFGDEGNPNLFRGTAGMLSQVPDYPRAYLPRSAVHTSFGKVAEDITIVRPY